jgi:WD40 repeat protein
VRSGEHHAARIWVSPDERLAVLQDNTHGWSWSHTSKIALWSLEQCERIDHLRGHATGIVSSVAFAPAMDKVATAAGDRSVCVFNMEGALLFAFRGHDDAVAQVAFVAPRTLMSLTGGKLRVWPLEATESKPAATHNTNRSDLESKESPWDMQMVGDYVLATSNIVRDRVGCWQRSNGLLLPSLRPPELQGGVTRGIAIHPLHPHLVFVGPNNKGGSPIPVLSLRESGRTVAKLATGRLAGHGGFHANQIAISKDGRWLAASTLWRCCLLWDLSPLLKQESGKEGGSHAATLTLEACARFDADHEHVWAVRFSPSGEHLLFTDGSSHAFVCDVPRASLLFKIPCKNLQLTFASDGCICELDPKARRMRWLSGTKTSDAPQTEVRPSRDLSIVAKEAAFVHHGPELDGRLGLVRYDGRLTLHTLDENLTCCGVVDSYTGSMSMRLDLDGRALCSKKSGLAGLELWDVSPPRACDAVDAKEGVPTVRGGRLRWTTRPTLRLDGRTSVSGATGISASNRRLIRQLRGDE